MAFYAGQIVKHPAMENPTLVVLTDRNDLDDQLFGTFARARTCCARRRCRPRTATTCASLLDRPSGGVDLHHHPEVRARGGRDDYPAADRPAQRRRHRRRGAPQPVRLQEVDGFAYGFAQHLRDALPNASFIGFTGTPIEPDDVNTPAVFGDYIDVYDISRAVEDGATVPIYYESRLAQARARRGREAQDRRGVRRRHRGRGGDASRRSSSAMGERRGARRRREAPRPGRRGPRRALRGPARGDRRQGDDRLHEPAHLRRRSTTPSSRCARMAQRR